MKIDAYTHFACPVFMDHLENASGHPMVFRGLFSAIPELSDIDLRIRFAVFCPVVLLFNLWHCTALGKPRAVFLVLVREPTTVVAPI